MCKTELLKRELCSLVSTNSGIAVSLSETSISKNFNYELKGYVIVWDDNQGNILRVQLSRDGNKGPNDIRFYCSKIDNLPHYRDVRFKKSSEDHYELTLPESLMNNSLEELGHDWNLEVASKIEIIKDAITQSLTKCSDWIILD